MGILSRNIFNSMLAVTLAVGVLGCASKVYLEPTTGDLTVFKFDFPEGAKKIIIYDQYRQCEGPNSVPFEKNETHKEIKVKRGEKISFTVESAMTQTLGKRRIITSCQNTFTLNTKAKEYEFKYVLEKGGCELKSVSINGDIDQEANLIPRQFMKNTTGPSCN